MALTITMTQGFVVFLAFCYFACLFLAFFILYVIFESWQRFGSQVDRCFGSFRPSHIKKRILPWSANRTCQKLTIFWQIYWDCKNQTCNVTIYVIDDGRSNYIVVYHLFFTIWLDRKYQPEIRDSWQPWPKSEGQSCWCQIWQYLGHATMWWQF